MTTNTAPGRTDDLSWDDGRTAVLRLPDELPSGRGVPAVVLLHPFGAWDRDAFLPAEASGNGPVRLFDDLGAALVRAGLAAAAFDTRFLSEDHHGGAGSPRFTFTGLVDDAVRVAERTRAHPDVDGDRVLLLGVSMGAEVAVAAAERLGGESHLAVVAPSAEARPVFQRWMGLDRRLEWLSTGGFTGADGSVDLAAAEADETGRSGWWEDFDLVDRFGPTVDLELLRAELALEYDTWERQALAHGDESAPASFWRDWFAQPAPHRRLAGLTGRITIHVGAEDWTTPPRQAHLLHRAALAHGLRSELTVHPRLGHLMSPRSAGGRRTYGPFDPDFLRALVASADAVLRPDPSLRTDHPTKGRLMEKLTLDELIELLNECNDYENPVDPTPEVLNLTFDALGYDSLTLLNAISKLERRYGIELPEFVTSDAKTPRELLAVVDSRLA